MNMHSLADTRQTVGYLESSGANLSQSLKRLSSGIKVDANDAGGLAVSSKLDSVLSRSVALGANVQNGMSFLESQDAAQSKLGAILTRMSELRVRYDDPSINAGDGANFNREFKELQEDVRSLAQKKFNGISLFSNGSDESSRLVIETDSVNRPNSGKITRNLFFKSILETQSSAAPAPVGGGPVGATVTTKGLFGSFGGTTIIPTGGKASVTGDKVNGLQGTTTVQTLTPTGGTASVTGDKVNGLQGTTTSQVIKGSEGSTTTQKVKGTAGGTTLDQSITAQRGTTPAKNDLKGAQGTTTGFNITAALAGTAPPPFSMAITEGTAPKALWQPVVSFNDVNDGFKRSSPVFDSNGDIIVGTWEDDELHRLDPNNGRILTTYDMGSGKNSAWKSAVTADTVYATNGNGKKLFAFDKVSGAEKWSKTLNEFTESPPFVHSNGNIYIATNSKGNPFFGSYTAGNLYGFKPDGTPLASSPTPVDGEFRGGMTEGPESSAGANDGTIYLTSKKGSIHNSLYAINPDFTGGAPIKWTKPTNTYGKIFRAAAIAPDDSVVVNSENGVTRAFNPNGTDKWTYSHAGGSTKTYGSPTIGTIGGKTTIFAASTNGVVALQPNATGTPDVLWNFSPGFNSQHITPAFDPVRNLVYVANTGNGDVIALDATGGGNVAGTQVWSWSPPTSVGVEASPALDANGNVYIGNTDGDFFAISVYDFDTSSTTPVIDVDEAGSGYDPLAPPPAVIIEGPDRGSLAATATVNDGTSGGPPPLASGTLKIAFTGKASGPNLTVTVRNISDTPPPVDPAGSGYLTTESLPAARVIATGIAEIIAANPTSSLKNNIVALIDGNTAVPAGGGIGAVTDSSGAGNDGTVAAGQEPVHETTDRRSGTGAYVFDGANDKIDLGHLNGLVDQSALTISAWIYRETTGDERIVCKSSGINPADHAFSMGVVDAGGGESKLRMRIGTDTMTATSMDGALTIPTQKWTHVAMTYNGSELRSYVNGELDPNIFSVNGKIDTATDSVTIGNVHTKTGGSAQDRHFEGMLDDVGIWNRSLTASEVESLAGPGNLTATTSINTNGTLKVTPVGTPATAGTFAVEVDSGEIRTPPNTIVGSGYDGGPPTAEPNPNVHITGTDVGTLKGFATVRSDGQLDINFTGKPDGTGNLTMTVDPGILRTTANLTVGSGYDGGPPTAEPAPTVHITGADANDLKGFATVRADGQLDINFTGTPSGPGTLLMTIDDGLNKAPPNTIVGSGYDGGPPTAEPNPNVHITGADVGTLKGFATVRSDGQLDINFTGNPAGLGDLTMTVDNGTTQKPADINTPTIGAGYKTGETPPIVSFGGTNAGTLKGTAVIQTDGSLKINFTGAPDDTADITMNVADGTVRAPADLPGTGSGYTFGDTPPTVTLTDLSGTPFPTPPLPGGFSATAAINGSGSLDITFAGNPPDTNAVTIQIDDGVGRLANQTGLGSGYATGETPTVTISGGIVSGTGNATVNAPPGPPAAGTLNVDLSAVRTDDLTDRTITIAAGSVRAPADLPGTGSGYTPGDTPPTVTLTDLSGTPFPTPPLPGGFSATAAINGSGSLDITFAGSPSDTNDVTIQIADGVGRLANLSDVGSGYAIGETPTVTISGGIVSGTGTVTVNDGITGPLGTLNVDLSTVRPDDLSNRTLTIASGALRTPATLTGIGANHDPASPPTVTMSGADLGGVIVNNVTVNLNGTVDVSFAGAPSGTGPLTVQVAGGSGSGSSGSGGISSQYLLDINGDLWDYSVSEFEAFTELVSDARAQNGAEQNSLGTFWELLSTNVNKLEQAAGRIKDADFAREMTELSKSQINSRSAAGLLGKQNRITSEALLTLQNLSNML